MMRISLRCLVGTVAFILLAGTCLAQAQEGTMVYARVANWQIARQNWTDYEQDLKKNWQPVMEKMLADGVITEYGAISTAIHTEDGYTHTNWWSARSLANLEKALAALEEANSRRSPAERKRSDTDFSGTKHSDSLVRSQVIKGRTIKLDGGYAEVGIERIQPGKAREFNEQYDKYTKPVYEKLFADGVVTTFGADTQMIHTDTPGIRVHWTIVPNADALDKMEAAFSTEAAKRSAEERQALARARRELVDVSAHRDELGQIIVFASKY